MQVKCIMWVVVYNDVALENYWQVEGRSRSCYYCVLSNCGAEKAESDSTGIVNIALSIIVKCKMTVGQFRRNRMARAVRLIIILIKPFYVFIFIKSLR